MDAALLKTLAQIAGIGGISLGVLLLIFRDVVRRRIFPQLAQVQAYRLIRLIVALTFLAAMFGVGAWVYVSRPGVIAGDRLPVQPDVALWTRNWRTINDGVPWMSTSGYSATNRAQLSAQLQALELPAGFSAAALRDDLLALVSHAETNPGDATYDMKVPANFQVKYVALRRAVRDQAISAGIDVGR